MKSILFIAFVVFLSIFDIVSSRSGDPYDHDPAPYYAQNAGYYHDSEFCSKRNPGNYAPPDEKCPNRFIMCLPSGQGHVQNCPPEALVFNGTHCDHASNVAGCEGTEPDNSDPFCKDKTPGDYASGRCRYHYITCTEDGKRVDRKCPYYTVFREECDYCDYRVNVKECDQYNPANAIPCQELPTTPVPGSYYTRPSYYAPYPAAPYPAYVTYPPTPTTPDIDTTPPPTRPPYYRPYRPYPYVTYPETMTVDIDTTPSPTYYRPYYTRTYPATTTADIDTTPSTTTPYYRPTTPSLTYYRPYYTRTYPATTTADIDTTPSTTTPYYRPYYITYPASTTPDAETTPSPTTTTFYYRPYYITYPATSTPDIDTTPSTTTPPYYSPDQYPYYKPPRFPINVPTLGVQPQPAEVESVDLNAFCQGRPNGPNHHPESCRFMVYCWGGQGTRVECEGNKVYNPASFRCTSRDRVRVRGAATCT